MPRSLKARVEARVRHWQARLRLGEWEIQVQMTARIAHAADCEARPEYRQAFLRFNPKRVPEDQWEAFIIHELLHCHVWKLAATAENLAKGDPVALEFVRQDEESLTTELERLVMGLLEEEG